MGDCAWECLVDEVELLGCGWCGGVAGAVEAVADVWWVVDGV